MKTSTAVALLMALFSTAPVHDQNRSDDAVPPRRVPFRRPDSKKHFDKAGMNSFASASLQDRDYSRPWRSAMEPHHKRSQRWMNSPEALLRKTITNSYSPPHANLVSGSNKIQSYADGVQTAWVKHYASQSLPSIDEATAIAIDGVGNVYVTGFSTKLPFGTDYLTIKYNAAGTQLWAARYGDGQGDNLAHAIAVDGAGNVYVTGSSVGSGTAFDYATIKYNATGIQQWVARYNGPGNSLDDAAALAVDGAGNVYVAGYSYGSGTFEDYATIKYNTAGTQQWVARYNGPGDSTDIATALTVDGAGNVYVTGYSYSSGTFDDCTTIKYNAAGIQQWIARYNGPENPFDEAAALAVDGAGNVYVTGESEFDYVTIKYSAAGIQQWAVRYNGPGEYSDDEATALAIDGAGNVYVTGSSYVEGTSNSYDYATIKYNAAGIQQWAARYNGPGGNSSDWANALAVDGAGNVYVTGYSFGSGTSEGYTTIKYNAVGIQQWVANFNGVGTALAIDGASNVYVTGYSSGTATIKYNASGVQQWVARYNGPRKNSSDGANALAVDGAGNVYVTGGSYGSETYEDHATIKYNAAGIEQWIVRYDGPVNDDDRAKALAVDGAGNVYVLGESEGLGTSDDYVMIKYNAAGIQQWIVRYDGPGNYNDFASALAIDGVGNVYVTGESVGHLWSIYTTIKYVQIPVAVKDKEPGQPNAYYLSQNYPNPFNPSTTIHYALAKPGHVTLKVFNLHGQEVATLVEEDKPVGEYQIQWNPINLSNGIYVYRLQAGKFVETKKLVLVK